MAKITFNLTFDSVTFNAKSETVELYCDLDDLVSEIGSNVLLDEIGEDECIRHFNIEVSGGGFGF